MIFSGVAMTTMTVGKNRCSLKGTVMMREPGIEDYRARIRAIQDSDEVASAGLKLNTAARNHIALKTARVFAVIDTGKRSSVYGVSGLTPSRTEEGLVVFEGNNLFCANIRYCFAPGMEVEITVPIDRNGAYFKIIHAVKMVATFCHVRVFKTAKAAVAYADKRNKEIHRSI